MSLNGFVIIKWLLTPIIYIYIIQKSNQIIKPKQFLIENVEIASLVKLPEIHIDDQLSNISKSASKHLNAFVRLKNFLDFEKRKVLINSFVLSNFNHCPLVWSLFGLCVVSLFCKKQGLWFLHNDYSSSYEDLLEMSGKATINVCNYCTLCTEIFKTLNNFNPNYEILKLRITNLPTRKKCKLNIEIQKSNQVSIWKIWNKNFETPWSKSLGLFAASYKIIWKFE